VLLIPRDLTCCLPSFEEAVQISPPILGGSLTPIRLPESSPMRLREGIESPRSHEALLLTLHFQSPSSTQKQSETPRPETIAAVAQSKPWDIAKSSTAATSQSTSSSPSSRGVFLGRPAERRSVSHFFNNNTLPYLIRHAFSPSDNRQAFPGVKTHVRLTKVSQTRSDAENGS
jgi:hypothetical protein